MTHEEILALKPEADRVMAIPGNTKGSSIKTDLKFLVQREGEEGLRRLEEAFSILGYPLKYGEIRSYSWYPEARTVLGIYVAQKLFGWDGKTVFEMGYAAPATSLLVKTIMRFASIETTFHQAPTLWQKHYDFGSFNSESIDLENKKLTFSVSGYGFFDYMTDYFDGFFTKAMELVGISHMKKLEGGWCSEGDHSCRRYEVSWT